MANNPPASTTVCKTDTVPSTSHHLDEEDIYAHDGAHVHHDHREPVDSETVATSELVSEPDYVEDGSYAQYHGHGNHNYQYGDAEGNSRQYGEHQHHPDEASHVHYNTNEQQRHYDTKDPDHGLASDADPHDVHQPHHDHHQRESLATTANSFDQVAEEIADDLEDFVHVEEQDLQNLAELIPERNHDRLFSEADPAPEPSGSGAQQTEGKVGDEAYQSQKVEPETIDNNNYQAHDNHHHHDHERYEDGAGDEDQVHEHHNCHEQMGHGEEYYDDGIENEDPIENHHQHDHDGAPADHEGDIGDNYGADGHDHEYQEHFNHEEEVAYVDEHVQGREFISGRSQFLSQPPESEVTLPGPPPSFNYRGERLSKNVADAMAMIWDKFWSEDIRQIARIIKNRFSQLMPYIRRFLAHVVAFWGGITYIRRAITAFIRLLKRDERVRELLERLGWACATTMKVFLSMCAMIMQATLQFYHLMRDRIIPDARRVIPILYYKVIMRLLAASRHSPWSIIFGPFSLTFAIDADRVPNRYYLHDWLRIPRDDVSFASMREVVQSIRESVYRTRYPQATESVSTPVHTNSTDETPVPPPPGYVGPKYRGSAKYEHFSERLSNGPLTERTNLDESSCGC